MNAGSEVRGRIESVIEIGDHCTHVEKPDGKTTLRLPPISKARKWQTKQSVTLAFILYQVCGGGQPLTTGAGITRTLLSSRKNLNATQREVHCARTWKVCTLIVERRPPS